MLRGSEVSRSNISEKPESHSHNALESKARSWHFLHHPAHAEAKNTATHAILYHPVEDGDTLSGLSIKYRVGVAEIKKVNSLWQDSEIHTRKWLKIPILKHGVLSETEADKMALPAGIVQARSLSLTAAIDIPQTDKCPNESTLQDTRKLLDGVAQRVENVRNCLEEKFSEEATLTENGLVEPKPSKKPGGEATAWLICLGVLIPICIPLYVYYAQSHLLRMMIG